MGNPRKKRLKGISMGVTREALLELRDNFFIKKNILLIS